MAGTKLRWQQTAAGKRKLSQMAKKRWKAGRYDGIKMSRAEKVVKREARKLGRGYDESTNVDLYRRAANTAIENDDLGVLAAQIGMAALNKVMLT